MISSAVKELQATKKKYLEQINGLQAQVQKIDSALAALNGTAVSSPTSTPKAKGKMSAAGRKAISMAAKARWAKINAGKTSAAKPAKKKRTMSAAARKAISLAVKARWAKQKSAAKKK